MFRPRPRGLLNRLHLHHSVLGLNKVEKVPHFEGRPTNNEPCDKLHMQSISDRRQLGAVFMVNGQLDTGQLDAGQLDPRQLDTWTIRHLDN